MIEATALVSARMQAAVFGLDEGLNFAGGSQIDNASADQIPESMIDRLLDHRDLHRLHRIFLTKKPAGPASPGGRCKVISSGYGSCRPCRRPPPNQGIADTLKEARAALVARYEQVKRGEWRHHLENAVSAQNRDAPGKSRLRLALAGARACAWE